MTMATKTKDSLLHQKEQTRSFPVINPSVVPCPAPFARIGRMLMESLLHHRPANNVTRRSIMNPILVVARHMNAPSNMKLCNSYNALLDVAVVATDARCATFKALLPPFKTCFMRQRASAMHVSRKSSIFPLRMIRQMIFPSIALNFASCAHIMTQFACSVMFANARRLNLWQTKLGSQLRSTPCVGT